MKKGKKWIKYSGLSLLVLVLTLSIVWGLTGGNSSKAAAGVINIGDSQENTLYKMRSKEITAYIEGIQAGSTVKWSISDVGVVKFRDYSGAGPHSIADGSSIVLQAAGLGETIITAVYTDAITKEIKTLVRAIEVPSAIMQDGTFFKNARNTDDSPVMILSLSDSTIKGGTLSMLYKLADNRPVTWTTSNPFVVSMSPLGSNDIVTQNTTGDFRATGTGKATITLTYVDDATGNSIPSKINVYVGPDVKVNDETPNGSGGFIAYKGDPISTGARMTDNNETLNDKISWVLTDSTGAKVLQKSGDGGSAYLSSNIYEANLTVTAPAGTYNLYVFTAGVYQSGDSLTSPPINNTLRQVRVIQVLPSPESVASKITMQIGDSYDFAKVMNILPEDFIKYFTLTLNGLDLGSTKDGVFTARDVEGETKYTLEFTQAGLDAANTFFGGTTKDIIPRSVSIQIYKGFTLDRSEASIYVGGSLQLGTLYEGNKGIITFTSSDPGKVTVDKNSGLITGKAATTGDNFVTIKASMVMSDGRTLTATCKVKVGVTATKITLDQTNVQMQIGGEGKTITATFTPNTITSANLQWLITDDSIVDVSVISSNRVTITAKKAGTAILTAVNKDNYITAYCNITVNSPIKTITISQKTAIVTQSQEVLKLRATYQPVDATANELEWTTDDSSIATVDEYGLVTLKKAGTCIITVMPVWNISNVMAQCRLTILSSPTSFELDKKALTLEVGGKETLIPVLVVKESTTTTTFKSMDTKVASVSAKGEVTAVGPGHTYIIATTKEGFADSCSVTVTQKASGIALSESNITIAVKETHQVIASPNPATSTEKTFTWDAKEPKIATVKDGLVTGVSAGSTTINVKTKSGDLAYLYVTVYDKATGMTLNYASKEVAKGSSFKLKPIFNPTNVTNNKVSYTSLNTKVATVDSSGTVKGVTGGAAIITCTSDDGGYLATCLVTVVEPITNIKLNYSSYKLGVGKSLTLKATVTSNASSNPKVKWTSSNSGVASVSSSGKVTGKKVGTATITATSTDGSKKKATCKITVVRQVSSMSMNKPILTLLVHNTQKLKVTIKPSNATYKTATWSSSDSNVAIVDSAGNVTGLSVGTCTIKAAAKDNSKKAVTCYVNVIDPIGATGIIVAAKDIILIKGQSQMISYTVTPANNTDKISFASDNKAIVIVSGTGKVTARRTGGATITLTSMSGKQAIINVTVIGLNKTSVSLEQYDTETLTVDGVTSAVTWYSSSPSIATVVGGKIVGRKPGTTTIYAKVQGITLSCKVTVKKIK